MGQSGGVKCAVLQQSRPGSGCTRGVLSALVGLVIALAAAGVVPGDAASSRQAAAWIAFSSSRSESGSSELYLMRADGTGERRLTTTRDPEIENPTWSPRGRQIALRRGPNGLSEWPLRPPTRHRTSRHKRPTARAYAG